MVDMLYSAIPPSSELYSRLQSEKALNILLVDFLFPFSCAIFYVFEEVELREIDEALEGIIKMHPTIFKSKLELDWIVADLRSLLNFTCQTFPGIENRAARLEKSWQEIEQRLVQELLRRQVTNAEEFVQKLLEGDRTFAPNLLSAGEYESLRLISRELVKEGASIFRQIDPKTLLAEDEGWYLDDLEDLKDLYLAADEHNEVILVGSS